MSVEQKLLNVCPDDFYKDNRPEIYSYSDFRCPTCNGQGFFYQSGYMQKFKKNLDDPDFIECTRCKGTGRLQAKIVIKWMPEDSPSKCPKEDEQ